MAKYDKMNMGDLDKAKYALEANRNALRLEMGSLALDSAGNAERIQAIASELKNIRIEMLAIQGEQDKLAVHPSPDAHHTIGVAGIVSGAVVGQIGGGGKKKK